MSEEHISKQITLGEHEFTVYLDVRDVSTQYGGGTIHQYSILNAAIQALYSDNELKHALEQVFENFYSEGVSCTHEWDCCGQWYPSTPRINHVDKSMTIIIQGFAQNV